MPSSNITPAPPATTSAISSSALPSNLTLLISNLSSFVSTKLDSSNYIIQKNQLQNILKATKLLGYVDGSEVCPPAMILDSNNLAIPNPNHELWTTIDAHLLSCITATLSPSIFTTVIQCKTSHEVWTVLASRFTSLSRSHIHQLKIKLSKIVKKGTSMEESLNQFQVLSDQLALASSPIDDEDLVMLILNGLPEEYNATNTAIRTR